jgi:L-alanine-DL-glutamate epimerase-like enolase superfamily enzyme
VKLAALRVHVLHASFASIFGDITRVPMSLRRPASHFQRVERSGQFSTLVEAVGDTGETGWGEAFGLPHPRMAASLIEAVMAPALIGAAIDDPAAALADLKAYFLALGLTRGAAQEAISAIDIALWDLKARAAGLPLCRLLGAEPGPVTTYVGSVPFLPTPGDSAERALQFAADGYRCVKLKVGRGAATDAAHTAALRQALGGDIAITLDANTAYGVDEAIEVARAIAPHDIAWFEEPIRPDDPQGLACVRAASPVPIAAGENEFEIAQFTRLAEAGALDIMQPNITRAGGISGLIAIDGLCRKHGLKLAPHGVGSAVGVSAALHACRAAGSFHMYEANRLLNPLRDSLSQVPLSFADGNYVAQDLPGHGVVPKQELLAEYALGGDGQGARHAAE